MTTFVLVLVLVLIYLAMGIRRVPIGAVGVVIMFGRRTGETRAEGLTWLPKGFSTLVPLYIRERQIRLNKSSYYTSDRVRLTFDMTLRIAVTNAATLFDQGPGTYGPFTSEATDEEYNVSLLKLVEDSVRTSVQTLSIQSVMFGGEGHQRLRDQITRGLNRTIQRWGLEQRELWLTDINANDEEMQRAVQAQVREEMVGRGDLAAYEVQASHGAVFARVAAELGDDLRRNYGQQLDDREVLGFLQGIYRSDRELDIALETARSQGGLIRQLSALAAPQLGGVAAALPVAPNLPLPAADPVVAARPVGPAGAGPMAAGNGHPPDGSWILGREGHIVFTADSVSRRHAQLTIAQGRMSLIDLGSANGTYIDGQRLPPNTPVVIMPGTTISLGHGLSLTGQQLTAYLQPR